MNGAVAGVFVLFHVVLLAFWAGAKDRILGYLFENGFDASANQAVYRFSQNEIAISIVLLLLTVFAVGVGVRGRRGALPHRRSQPRPGPPTPAAPLNTPTTGRSGRVAVQGRAASPFPG